MNYSDFDSLTGLGNTRLMQARFAQLAGDRSKFGLILIDIANLAGVVNFLPHPSPPLGKGME
jgi:GGDEF domain-containing protein